MMEIIYPGSFEPSICFQGNEQRPFHKVVKELLTLTAEEVVNYYTERYPNVDKEVLLSLLKTKSHFYKWGGSDMMPYVAEDGQPEMKLIEVNCCPGGSSFAPFSDSPFAHIKVIESCFAMKLQDQPEAGVLAVLYNLPKNRPDVYGYATALADLSKQPVYLVDIGQGEPVSHIRWDTDGTLWLVNGEEELKVHTAFKRLGLQPWTQVPLVTGETELINPSVVCIGGGHNKVAAAKAFKVFNSKYSGSGLKVNTPETFTDVSKKEIPSIAEKFSLSLAVKVPYSAAGLDVYLISNHSELDTFMKLEDRYEKYLVQQLLLPPRMGNGKLQPKTLRPVSLNDPAGDFIYDLRIVVACGNDGWKPVHIMARRAEKPVSQINSTATTDILKTNVSRKNEDGSQKLKESVSLCLTEEIFNCMNLSIVDLVEGYVQSILGITAVDEQCRKLFPSGELDVEELVKLNEDKAYLSEIGKGSPNLRDVL